MPYGPASFRVSPRRAWVGNIAADHAIGDMADMKFQYRLARFIRHRVRPLGKPAKDELGELARGKREWGAFDGQEEPRDVVGRSFLGHNRRPHAPHGIRPCDSDRRQPCDGNVRKGSGSTGQDQPGLTLGRAQGFWCVVALHGHFAREQARLARSAVATPAAIGIRDASGERGVKNRAAGGGQRRWPLLHLDGRHRSRSISMRTGCRWRLWRVWV